MKSVPKNRFKSRLLAGDLQIGLWIAIPSIVSAEALSLLDYDWLAFDGEHTPVEVAGILPLLQAAATGNSELIVRPAWNDLVQIKRVLDIGAKTVLLPFIESAKAAQEAVQATQYPNEGVRGVAGLTRASRYGLVPGYLEQANDQICTLVQVETSKALNNLEAIAGVDGVDGVFIGPADLSASLGYLGQSSESAVQTIFRDAAKRIDDAGSSPGILATTPDAAKRYIDWGYKFVAINIDLNLLLNSAQKDLEWIRKSVT
ncbi:MAG: HpcH/HpaI aldolase/citrate lyase family protein [Aestuariivita sp.]|nr:HpcH/HpaI aldolase/citrate lyase family protein [Aestuariivita sp.]